MNQSPPFWIPLFFGCVLIIMGGIILGAALGLVPTDGGRFMAPLWIIYGLSICLISGGLCFWLPEKTPAIIKSLLLLIMLGSLALVCNWTAFAPGLVYESSAGINGLEISGVDQVGGRIAFGLAAVVVDVFILTIIAGWIRLKIH